MSLEGRAIMRKQREAEKAERIRQFKEQQRLYRMPRWCSTHGPILYGTRCLTCEREREQFIVNPHVIEHVPEPLRIPSLPTGDAVDR